MRMYPKAWAPAAAALLALLIPTSVAAGDYVGSKSCGSCHEAQYKNFSENSKKATSWKSVAVMAPKLKQAELQGCYECHTTGFGKGGFVSLEKTPELAEVGCESCHGPGRKHAESGDPKDIAKPGNASACTGCHSAERVQDFRFKPLLVSGAH